MPCIVQRRRPVEIIPGSRTRFRDRLEPFRVYPGMPFGIIPESFTLHRIRQQAEWSHQVHRCSASLPSLDRLSETASRPGNQRACLDASWRALVSNLIRSRTSNYLNESVRANPLLKSCLYLFGAQLEVVPRCENGLIQRQVHLRPRE